MPGERTSPAVSAALAEADRRDRWSRMTVYAAALVEAILLAAALLVMDTADRTHLLVFIMSMLAYTTLALGLIVLGTRASAESMRVLHALQLLDERLPPA